jgi:hypothetical protein
MAGVLAIGWNFFARYALHLSTLLYGDFVAGFVFRRTPENNWEMILSVVIAFLFLGFLGMVFAFLIPHIKSSFLPIKSWVAGIALWLPYMQRPSCTGYLHWRKFPQ